MARDLSVYKKKALLLLLSGAVLAFSPSSSQHLKIYKNLPKAWKDIDREKLRSLVWEFRRKRLVDLMENPDGSATVILTEDGRKRALRYKIDEIKINQSRSWDGLWRLVIFDIPERRRKARDALRNKLRELGFEEFQKSVFVCPYPCQDEVDFVVEYFEVRPHVRYVEAKFISNEAELKLKFDLV